MVTVTNSIMEVEVSKNGADVIVASWETMVSEGTDSRVREGRVITEDLPNGNVLVKIVAD